MSDESHLVCPECNGRGVQQTVVNRRDVVCEQPCPACGGSGKASDALYGKLADLVEERREFNRIERLAKGFKDNFGL